MRLSARMVFGSIGKENLINVKNQKGLFGVSVEIYQQISCNRLNEFKRLNGRRTHMPKLQKLPPNHQPLMETPLDIYLFGNIRPQGWLSISLRFKRPVSLTFG